MDAVAPLAGQLVQILTPFLPLLVRAGEGVGAAGAAQLRDHGWAMAQEVWARLAPGVQIRPAAQEAAADVARQPDDPDAQAALRVQVRKLLADDPALHQALTALLADSQPGGQINVEVRGDRSVGIGRDVHDSTIITGDAHRPSS